MIRDFTSKLMARLAAISALLKSLIMPLMSTTTTLLLNVFIGILAVWLAVLGEWKIVLAGAILAWMGRFIIAFLLAPGMGILFLISYLSIKFPALNALTFANSKVKYIALIVGFAAPMYILGEFFFAVALTSWGVGVLYLFLLNSDIAAYIPAIIWSHTVATGTFWSFCLRAWKDNEKDPPIKDDGKILTAGVTFSLSYTIAVFVLLWHGAQHGAPISMHVLQLIAVAMVIILMTVGVIRTIVYAWINRRQSPPR